jgi:putative ABC transport system permease protein
MQFLGESILLCLFAYVLAIGLTNALHPVFNSLLNKNIPLKAANANGYLLLLFAIAVSIGAIAGIYPALVMSGFNPIAVLKGRFAATKNGLVMRQTLVVFQFTISTVLIIGTIVIYNQLRFMQNQDLGFKKDQELAINYYGDSAVRVNIEHVRQELRDIPGVKAVAFSGNIPGISPNDWYSQIENNHGDLQGANFNFYVVDFDFFNHYGIKMAAGRSFSNQYATDSTHARASSELLRHAPPCS